MVYTQFISELSEHREPCCPVCRRSFPSESEVQEVVRVLQSKLHLVPEKLKITEQDLERTERRREEIVALRPVRYSVRRLCQTNSPVCPHFFVRDKNEESTVDSLIFLFYVSSGRPLCSFRKMSCQH